MITGLWIGVRPFAQLISRNTGTLCILPQHFQKFSGWPGGALKSALKTKDIFVPD